MFIYIIDIKCASTLHLLMTIRRLLLPIKAFLVHLFYDRIDYVQHNVVYLPCWNAYFFVALWLCMLYITDIRVFVHDVIALETSTQVDLSLNGFHDWPTCISPITFVPFSCFFTCIAWHF